VNSAADSTGPATLPRENVQSYPRPPALESVPQRITITLGGAVIADTSRALRVLETHHPPTYYLPPEDVVAKLVPVSGSSFCEWKGVARYFDVVGGAAWSYDEPTGPFERLAGYLAFYPEKMEECRVGGHVAVAQPGSFYGGWVTPNLDGVPKGARGTEHW